MVLKLMMKDTLLCIQQFLFTFIRRARNSNRFYFLFISIIIIVIDIASVGALNKVNACSGEIVGSNGRIGNFLLGQSERIYGVPYAAVTRNNVEKCGRLSEPGTPIIFCVGGNSVYEVLKYVPAERRKDVCLFCNGLFTDIEDVTIAVPHFGILSVGAEPICKTGCPPTVVYGKHAENLAVLIHPLTVKCETYREEIDKYAVQKLLWSSTLWLFTSKYDISVEKVHQKYHQCLENLIKELLPAADKLLKKESKENSKKIEDGSDCNWNANSNKKPMFKIEEVMEYLKAYSNSMPGAKPSIELALKEAADRNGRLLAYACFKEPQSLHKRMLSELGVDVINIIK